MSDDTKVPMTEQEALAKIADLLNAAHESIREAQKIADEAGVGFHWDLAYGMGGWYTSKKEAARDAGEEDNPDWEPSGDETGWRASSQSC